MRFLTAEDLYFFTEGLNSRLYEKMGAHILPGQGVHFAVWAPNAKKVSVIGDFNGWDKSANPLQANGHCGIWSGIVPHATEGQCYKYFIHSNVNDYCVEKADPVAFSAEAPPRTASVIRNLDYQWGDQEWTEKRALHQSHDKPMSIYELHPGSWRRKASDHNRPLTYLELGDELIPYILETGFTHVEFMPVMEHPFGGSWGYQVTGYFSPTSRYGNPQDFMHLIDRLHQAGIGIILDWVPSHFPGDEHGLAFFDGTYLYEHADPRKGFHPDWQSYIFNYGRNEVRSFLISNAMFWLDKYHIDGLRVDAVASMLYLDYSRKSGEWIPNEHGGRENIDAIHFLKQLNETVYAAHPHIQMIAEESTAWPGVTKPTYLDGLGFGMKWDMGWMNDTLKYFQKEPVHRKFHQNELTFRSVYAFHENFILALSHDEVVHGKGSMLNKMPGDTWQKFANLRCLYTYMMSQPGKKLFFMGGEIASWSEWNHDASLDWHLLEYADHRNIKSLISDLNHLYRDESALQCDHDPAGYHILDFSDSEQSVIVYLRKNPHTGEQILCAFNFTPIPRNHYRIGVPNAGRWQEIFNSDNHIYGGSTGGSYQTLVTGDWASHGQIQSLEINLPPLGGIFLKWIG